MKILLVDDALDMRLVMKRTLSLLGHEVQLAEDGAAAWELLQQQHFEVLITDWLMPHMDGPELCRKVRATDFGHYIYIILLTGMSGKLNLIAGMDAGADDFANKPIERDEMAVLLRAAERVIALEKRLEQQNHDLEVVNQSLCEAQAAIRHDLQYAATLQSGILPAQQSLGKLSFAWFFRPASFIGGDTFNYFPLNDELTVYFTLDVSGHGIASALMSMYLTNLLTLSGVQIEEAWLQGGELQVQQVMVEIISRLNRHLLQDIDQAGHYFTLIFGVIDTAGQRMSLLQAGHPRPMLMNRAMGTVTELELTGFPVGLLDAAQYQVESLPFGSGDRMIVFSDGIFEIAQENGQLLKPDVLAAALREAASLTAQDTVKSLCNCYLAGNEKENLPDDVSLLIIDFA